MRPLLICALLSLWITFPAAAHAKKSSMPRDGFYYGMSLADANKLAADTVNYKVAYRVDTKSTSDIFCRYQEHTMYLAHFLRGTCHAVEKRAIVSFDDADKMFTSYFGALGKTDEVAQAPDGRSRYAKWRFKDRELTLSCYGRDNGTYLLIHEEYDPARVGEASVTQARELAERGLPSSPVGSQPPAPSAVNSDLLPTAQTDLLPGGSNDLLPRQSTDLIDGGPIAPIVIPPDPGLPSDPTEKAVVESSLPPETLASPAAAQQWQDALPQSGGVIDAKAGNVVKGSEQHKTVMAKPAKEKAVKEKPAKAVKDKSKPKPRKVKAEKSDKPPTDPAAADADKVAVDADKDVKDKAAKEKAAKDKPKTKDLPRITDTREW